MLSILQIDIQEADKMIKVVYSREVAVKEGFRKSAEINKGDFKRPFLTHSYGDYKAKDFNQTREAILNGVTKIVNDKMQRSFQNVSMLLCTSNSNVKKSISKIWDSVKKINVAEAIELDSFKNRTIYVYVEKQNGSIYTVKNIAGLDKDQIYDIHLGDFYDIAGKLVYINLNKKHGEYKVNQIVKALD